jgi:hypothetical protein
MRLEAIVSKNDLTQLVAEALPLTMQLGDDGELSLSDATQVTLIPDVGLRIVGALKLRWSVLGITVPITVRSFAVVLRPEVTGGDSEHGEQLTFKVQLDHADVAGLPSPIDQGVVVLVNRELEKHMELAWGYARTLTQSFDLPDTVQPLESFDLNVDSACVKTTDDALGLAIRFHARVRRRGESTAPARGAATNPGRRAAEDPSGPSHGTTRDGLLRPGWSEVAGLAGLGVLGLLGGYAIGARGTRR